MITRRQAAIIELLDHSDMSLRVLSEALSVSEKTIANDIRHINEEDIGEEILKKQGMCSVIIHDEARKNRLLQQVHQNLLRDYSDPAFRVQYIMARLLRQHGYMRAMQLEDEMSVSRSTLTTDLAAVRNVLAHYDLSLELRPHYGMRIAGRESDIRRLIVQRLANLYLANSDGIVHTIYTRQIRRILTDTLVSYEFRISDIVFQNLVIFLSIAVLRMQGGNNLEPSEKLSPAFYHSLCISQDILSKCAVAFQIQPDDSEKSALAVELQCNREVSGTSSINREINDFVFETLQSINEKYNADFLSDIDLRISLALHTGPLIARLHSGNQLSNSLTLGIKQGFPYAYDLASEYAYPLSVRYHASVKEDETAYLAVHFIAALSKTENSRNSRKVLLISRQRKSNTILIQQQLLNWFPRRIEAITVCSVQEIEHIHPENFDLILTTEPDIAEAVPSALAISFFLSEKERISIEMSLSGISRTQDILNQFHPELFYAGPAFGKDDMIRILSAKAATYYDMDHTFHQSVVKHETIANTYFGNHIVMPHPDQMITSDSFICVGIPATPIQWDDQSDVRLVLLVSIQKDNPSALNIWQYLSYFITSDTVLSEILKDPTWDHFISVIDSFFREKIGR